MTFNPVTGAAPPASSVADAISLKDVGKISRLSAPLRLARSSREVASNKAEAEVEAEVDTATGDGRITADPTTTEATLPLTRT